MMGGKTLESCWAVNKRHDNKLKNCCNWLVIYLKLRIKSYKGGKYLKFRKKKSDQTNKKKWGWWPPVTYS
jgi:hypothetical protein